MSIPFLAPPLCSEHLLGRNPYAEAVKALGVITDSAALLSTVNAVHNLVGVRRTGG